MYTLAQQRALKSNQSLPQTKLLHERYNVVPRQSKSPSRDVQLRRGSVGVASVGPQRAADSSAPSLIERTFDSNWRSPLEGHDHPDPAGRPIIALGKFDALHKGHQALAAAALALGGCPVLLSFSGMGAVLGWQPRKPLVAPCDRPRVLELWAQQLAQQRQQQQQQQAISDDGGSNSCSGAQAVAAGQHSEQRQRQQQQQQPARSVVPIRQRYIPFAAIRSMSPEAFVELLAKELGAAGVVAGANYRFGYRAAGDSALLQQLCGAAGLPVSIVELVGPAEPGAVGVVSSSKIREMLSACRIEAAKKSLGRPYRLVATMHLTANEQQHWGEQQCTQQHQQQQQQAHGLQQRPGSNNSSSSGGNCILVRQAEFLNQHPGPGVYFCSVQLFIGASPHDDLLQLQRVSAAAAAGDCSSSTGSSSTPAGVQLMPGLQIAGSSCVGAVRSEHMQVELSDAGLLLPQEIVKAAAASMQSSRRNLPARSASSCSAGSSGNHTSRQRGRRANCELNQAAADPICWDTDDNEDASIDEADGVSALLVLDFERCLVQTCTVEQSSSSSSSPSTPASQLSKL